MAIRSLHLRMAYFQLTWVNSKFFLNGEETLSACLIVQNLIFAFVLRSSWGHRNLVEI